MKSVFVFAPLRKHLAGQHDQSSHGSWAGEKLDEKRVALVKEVETIRSNWSQVVAVPTDVAIKILSGERYTSVFANNNLQDSQSRTKMEERLSREESVLGIPKDAPSSERPVYGYMADKNKKLVPNLIEEIGYGDVYFVLKPDVKNRSTMTMGDSIQVTGKAFPLTGKVTPQQIKNGYVSADWNRGYFPFWEDYPETQISGGFSISDVSEIIVSPTFRSNTNEIGIIQQKSQTAGINFSSNVTKHLAGQHDQSSHGSWASDNDVFTELNYWEQFNEYQTFYPNGDIDPDFKGVVDKKELFEKLLRKIENQQVEAGYVAAKHTNEGSAVLYYIENGHKEMNTQLRDPSLPEKSFVTDKIKKVDRAIDEAPALKEPMLAYRGVANQGLMGSFFFNKLKVGDTFQDLGYVSTTISPKVATKFAGSDKSKNSQGIILQYHLPKGTKGLFLNPFIKGQGWDEFEFLLPRSSKFKVTQIRGKIIDLEIVQ